MNIKRLDKIISKREVKLSKKNNCLYKKTTNNAEIKLCRDLLNLIDRYKFKEKNLTTYRHYRYKVMKFGTEKIKKFKEK